VLAGQTHMVKAKVLAPVLVDYFAGGRAVVADREADQVLDSLSNAVT
jgi:hypothetical protein